MVGQPAASAEAVSPPATENANGKLLAAIVQHRTDRDAVAAQIGTHTERELAVGLVDAHIQV